MQAGPSVSSGRSLVAAAEAAAAEQLRQSQAERAVLVSVEFTGERRKLTTAARQARRSALAALRVEDDPDNHDIDQEHDGRDVQGREVQEDRRSAQDASRAEATNPASGSGTGTGTGTGSGINAQLGFDAALEEFQELARSAGAVVAAT